MYCNWLCNNQSGSPGALDHGAYNTDTFSTNPDQTFNDQLTHTPGAAFWIPTLDEWLKAAHFDPNKFGAGQGGWWQYPNRSDVALNYGPPGEGQANAGFTLPDFGQWSIPLTSYPATLSAWGMLDSAGGSAEWLEDALGQGGPRYRGVEGSYAGLGLYLSELNDRATRFYSDSPHIAASYQGFRIASIPCPATALMGVMLIPGVTLRRRRP